MEYAGDTNLKNFIEQHFKIGKQIDEDILNEIIKQMCIGLKEIHKQKIIHRDIKPENIFLDKENFSIKIGDFGISKIVLNGYTTTKIGTHEYMAQEIYGGNYTNKIDIYALGCIFYELFNLSVYYYDKTSINRNIQQVDLDIYKKKGKECQVLINKMLEENPNERFDIGQVLDYLKKNNIK